MGLMGYMLAFWHVTKTYLQGFAFGHALQRCSRPSASEKKGGMLSSKRRSGVERKLGQNGDFGRGGRRSAPADVWLRVEH